MYGIIPYEDSAMCVVERKEYAMSGVRKAEEIERQIVGLRARLRRLKQERRVALLREEERVAFAKQAMREAKGDYSA